MATAIAIPDPVSCRIRAYSAIVLTQLPKSEITCPYQRFLKEGFCFNKGKYPIESSADLVDFSVFTV